MAPERHCARFACNTFNMSLRAWSSHIKRKVWVWDDTYSIGQIAHLSRLFHDILPLARLPSRLYGYNFIFNNQSNTCLGDDGYDNYQAPTDGGHALFLRRMWVSGSLHLNALIRPNDIVRCTEQVRAVRQVGPSVFVTVGRKMTRADELVMEEMRTLIYTNDKYTPKKSETLGAEEVRPAETLDCGTSSNTMDLVFRLSHVMRFCALSYNLHKIHHDRQFCAKENLANVVVPGPLLALVMLHYADSVFPNREIATFNYRNSLPCYIDDPVRLELRPHNTNYEVRVVRHRTPLATGILILK